MSTPSIVATRIRRVTVYRNGALVERGGHADPGAALVTGLPLLYSADSLRVRPAVGRIVDLRETCAVERRGPTDRAASAEAIERLSVALEELDADARAVDARIGVYTNLAPAAPNKVHLPPPELLLEMHDTAGERLAELEARRIALRTRRRALERELEAARAEVHADPTPPRFTRGVRFTLVDADAPVEVVIEYFVAAARWVPAYRLDLEGGRAQLRLDAQVAQATGEDWTGVQLRLGTADLERSTGLPDLDSWRIGTAGVKRRPAFRPLPTDLERLFSGYDRARQRAVVPPEPTDEVTGVHHEVEDTVSFRTEEDTRTMVRAMPVVGGAPAPPGALPPAPAAPAPARTLARYDAEHEELDAPMAELARGGMFGGGGGPTTETVTAGGVHPPGGEGHRRLRYAYLRLAGPEEPGRGTLRPVDALTHLWSLVEDHDVADPELLRRAVGALRAARQRLRALPLPQGTRPTGDGYHHVFAASGMHDVPTDGIFHRAVVRSDDAPAQVTFRAVPRESRDVFRFCTVQPGGAVPYPAGPMQVYIDGTFRVTAPLRASGGGVDLELNLGLDQGVRVVDRVVEVAQQDKGLMSHTTHVVHTVTLRVRSSVPEPTAVVLFDRVPVAPEGEKDIEVTLLDSEPAPEETDRGPHDDRLRGGLRWRLTLPPSAERTVVWRYRVAFPAKAELVGGNRRE